MDINGKKISKQSVPIVHHVTIPCSESLLVSSSEGAVAAKVPHLAALGTFLLFLGVVLYLPTCFDALGILLPMCVSVFFEVRDYLPNGILLFGPPWDMIPHLQCNPVICISSFQHLLPLHKLDVLEGPLGVEVCNLLNGEQLLLLPLVICVQGGQSGLIS